MSQMHASKQQQRSRPVLIGSPMRTETLQNVFAAATPTIAGFKNAQPGSILDELEQKIVHERSKMQAIKKHDRLMQDSETFALASSETQPEDQAFERSPTPPHRIEVTRKISVSVPEKVTRIDRKPMPSPQEEQVVDRFEINQEKIVNSIENVYEAEAQGSLVKNDISSMNDELAKMQKALYRMSKQAERDAYLKPLVMKMQEDLCVAQQYICKTSTKDVSAEVECIELSPSVRKERQHVSEVIMSHRAESPCKMVQTDGASEPKVVEIAKPTLFDKETNVSPSDQLFEKVIQTQPAVKQALFTEEDVKREIELQIERLFAEQLAAMPEPAHEPSGEQVSSPNCQNHEDSQASEPVQEVIVRISKRIKRNIAKEVTESESAQEICELKRETIKVSTLAPKEANTVSNCIFVSASKSASVGVEEVLLENNKNKPVAIPHSSPEIAVESPILPKVPLEDFLDTKEDDMQVHANELEHESPKLELNDIEPEIAPASNVRIELKSSPLLSNSMQNSDGVKDTAQLMRNSKSDSATTDVKTAPEVDLDEQQIINDVAVNSVAALVNTDEGFEMENSAKEQETQQPNEAAEADREEQEERQELENAFICEAPEEPEQDEVKQADILIEQQNNAEKENSPKIIAPIEKLPKKEKKKQRAVKKAGSGKPKHSNELVDHVDALDDLQEEQPETANPVDYNIQSSELDDISAKWEQKTDEQVAEQRETTQETEAIPAYRPVVGQPVYVYNASNYSTLTRRVIELLKAQDVQIVRQFSEMEVDVVIQLLREHGVKILCARDTIIDSCAALKDAIDFSDFTKVRFVSDDATQYKELIDKQDVFAIIEPDAKKLAGYSEMQVNAVFSALESTELRLEEINNAKRIEILSQADLVVDDIISEVVALLLSE